MSFLTIDTDADPLFYNQITQLEGVEYLLQFKWSNREGAWYLGIYDQDENPIAVGIKIVVSFPLLRRFVDPRLPPGRLIAIDMSNQNREIEVPSDLNSRVLLTYITIDDVEGIAAVDAIAA